ncbi:MAG TPA: DeoR/GlpR family DNA-binding transcription regulator [Polyangiaceae bacterium]|jgi:DeoR family ulaG and ulaABCDEF operon transcriptional repressor|nr:DeoR/GlpR family DNA-binding transcription regulator [Polyangiaceae bacterium]
MHEAERTRLILRALEGRAVVTIGELTSLLGASEATVRRDLTRLAEEGQIRRVRGGAEAATQGKARPLVGQPRFEASRALNVERKRQIAKSAAALCESGDTIMIGGGTTTFAMVEVLTELELSVLTNSFPIASFLYRHAQSRVILPGGELYREQGVILSPFEDDSFKNYVVSKLFLGAQAVGPQGLMQSDPTLIRAEQQLIDQCEKLFVLVDSSKFKQRASLILCPLSLVDTLITDSAIDAETLKMLQGAAIDVVIVENPRDAD